MHVCYGAVLLTLDKLLDIYGAIFFNCRPIIADT